MNIKAWIHSAVVAILSMVVGAVEQYFQSGGVLPQNSVQWHSFIASIAGTAVLGVTALLKSSPLLPPPPVNLSSNVPNSKSTSKYGGLLPLMLMAVLIVSFAGCKAATVTQPLAPGYSSQADQTIGQTLAAARGYYGRIQTDVAAGTYKPGAAEFTAYQAFGQSINTAEAAYLAYHGGTGTLAAAQTAANKVSTQQAALQAAGVK